MALFNYGIYSPGEWVPINPIRVDDGFGNLIVNEKDNITKVLLFIKDGKE